MSKLNNPYDSAVKVKETETIYNILPDQVSKTSLAVTCGTPLARSNLLYYYLYDAVKNKLPVVILYNGNGINNVLNNINGLERVDTQHLRYDPLYGKDILTIVNLVCLISEKKHGNKYSTDNVRRALNNYLYLLSPADKKDITLDKLKWLLNLNEDNISRFIWSSNVFNPNQKKFAEEKITPYYSAKENENETINEQVRNIISALESVVEGKLWQNDKVNYAVNISETLKRGGIIAIRLDDQDPELLDFIGKELSIFNNRKFVLACCDLKIKKETILGGQISLHCGGNGNPLFISSDNLSSDFSSDNQLFWAEVASNDLLVLNCGNALRAAPYKEYVGQYLKRIVSTQTNRQRDPFAIFSGHGDSRTTSEELFDRLLSVNFCLRRGCVCCSNNNILVVKHLEYLNI